jgi:hypothetical protein
MYDLWRLKKVKKDHTLAIEAERERLDAERQVKG